jgi:hypothetical protein
MEPRITHDATYRRIQVAKDRGCQSEALAEKTATGYLKEKREDKNWKFLGVETLGRDWVVVYGKMGRLY